MLNAELGCNHGIFGIGLMVICIFIFLHSCLLYTSFICGFSMETENLIENSRKKLEKKNCDMIAANNLKCEGAGFGTDTNIITLITNDSINELPFMTKEQAADRILDVVLGNYN